MSNANSWHGLLKVLEFNQIRDGKIITQFKNIKNLLHASGENFILQACFFGGQTSSIIPDNYYLGLDNRENLDVSDTMVSLTGEPSGNGYSRQTISSAGSFVISYNSSHYIATSPIVSFQATGSSWGPVNNLFLTTATDNSGFLISSVLLPQPVTVAAGDVVTLRTAMSLKDCP